MQEMNEITKIISTLDGAVLVLVFVLIRNFFKRIDKIENEIEKIKEGLKND